MCRPPSPIFDSPIPELPTLRRMKPLPKRRRTADPVPHHDDGEVTPPSLSQHISEHSTQVEEQTPVVPDPTLAAQMALQAYYKPVLGGVRDLFKTTTPADGQEGQSQLRTSTPISIDLSAALAAAGLGTGGMNRFGGVGLEEEDDGGDGDYMDHLEQPGNTKKRKVPGNMVHHGHDAGSTGSGGEDELDRGDLAGRERDVDLGLGGGAVAAGGGAGTQLGMLAGKKGRLSRATIAGLYHKETLRSRKRQVVSVLGELTHDTLALDQALSASHVFVQPGVDLRMRLSRRRTSRLARALKAYNESHAQAEEDENRPPSSDFTFVWHCATSDRLVATNEEVATLHRRFEAELARQAAKVAEAAKQAAENALSGPLAKRADRSKQVSRTVKTTDQKGTLEQSPLVGKGKGKKKKRSALANASNPHHLRNYVPSRLPHGGPPSAQQAVQNAQNLLAPLPLRFLSAEIPPPRRKKAEPNVTPISTVTNPEDEWICPFCEYELFYGDKQSYHRAVRSRKKILRRRRRARERAAAAASGVAPAPAAASVSATGSEDVGHGSASASASAPALPTVTTKDTPSGGKQRKEGDRGGT